MAFGRDDRGARTRWRACTWLPIVSPALSLIIFLSLLSGSHGAWRLGNVAVIAVLIVLIPWLVARAVRAARQQDQQP